MSAAVLPPAAGPLADPAARQRGRRVRRGVTRRRWAVLGELSAAVAICLLGYYVAAGWFREGEAAVTVAALHLVGVDDVSGVLPGHVLIFRPGGQLLDGEVTTSCSSILTVVALTALTHCVGMSVHRHGHEDFSLFLAEPKLRQLVQGLYNEPDLTVVVSEVLQGIISHRSDGEPLTLEAGILRVADARRGIAAAPTASRRSTASPRCTTRTPRSSPTPTSTRCTTHSRTACTRSGPSPRWKRASTCCARSRSPSTRTLIMSLSDTP